jgi:hypothetical protein
MSSSNPRRAVNRDAPSSIIVRVAGSSHRQKDGEYKLSAWRFTPYGTVAVVFPVTRDCIPNRHGYRSSIFLHGKNERSGVEDRGGWCEQ